MMFLKYRQFNFLILFATFFFFSCKKDLKDKNNFAEHLIELIKGGEKEKLMDLYIMPKDSLLMNDSSLYYYFKLHSTPEEIDRLNLLHISQIEDCIKEFEEKGILKQSVSEIEAKYDSIYSFPVYDENYAYWFEGTMEITFRANLEYKISIGYVVLTKEGWKITSLSKPITKQEEKEMQDNLTFMDSRVSYLGSVYTINSLGNTFENVEIRISNKSPYDFNYIKYKISLLALNKKNNEYDQELFSKTIELKQDILAGDFMRIHVNELKDYYSIMDLTNKNGFKFDVRILGLKPIPN